MFLESYYLSSSLLKDECLRGGVAVSRTVRATLMMSSVRRDCREIIISILRATVRNYDVNVYKIREDNSIIIKIVDSFFGVI